MIPKEMTFTAKEAAAAAGVDLAKFTAAYRRRVADGDIPPKLKALTYDQVKLILTTRPKGAPDPQKIDVLKRQLIDDGLAKK